MSNTLNVCLGHLPFPQAYEHHIDLMVAPTLIAGPRRLAWVDDQVFGPHGSALSEYVQLFWVLKHLNEIAAGCSFIRIFHYRRFVALAPPSLGQQSANLPWATTIREHEVGAFDASFDRHSTQETFNTPVRFPEGMLGQYAAVHDLEDMLNFAKFLMAQGVFSPAEAARFLKEDRHIPSCNIGVLKLETYCFIFEVLLRAAQFLHSDYFVARTGYQRRSVGFLLERLNSHLIFRCMEAGVSQANFGHNIVISDAAVVSATQ